MSKAGRTVKGLDDVQRTQLVPAKLQGSGGAGVLGQRSESQSSASSGTNGLSLLAQLFGTQSSASQVAATASAGQQQRLENLEKKLDKVEDLLQQFLLLNGVKTDEKDQELAE